MTPYVLRVATHTTMPAQGRVVGACELPGGGGAQVLVMPGPQTELVAALPPGNVVTSEARCVGLCLDNGMLVGVWAWPA